MEQKFYAVKVGKVPGIYRSWDECKENVNGFSKAVYKSFKTMPEAEAFMGMGEEKDETGKEKLPYAFVDGSFNIANSVYGYGGFLIADGKKYVLTGLGTDKEMADMRNVAGEVLGAIAAVKKAIELGIPEIDIYYDYMGIEMWATGAWKRNKKGTIAYHDYMTSVKDIIKVNFIKVKGHSGVSGNEEADMLAKKAVGII